MDHEQDVIAGLMTDAEAAIADGATHKASALYSGVLALDPGHVLSLRQLGGLAVTDGRYSEAVVLFERALKGAPADPDLYHGIGTALRLGGFADNAILAFEAALRVDPRHHPSLYDLALLFQQRGQLGKADALYAKAADARWGHFESILNRGVVLFRQDRLAEAERWFHHAGLVKPEDPRPLINLAMIYRIWGRIGPAITCLERAIALAPDNADANWNLANAYLVAGRLKEGFAAYEWRFRRSGRAQRAQAVPRWSGDSLSGKTILLTAEQGVGDIIHFVRYVGELARLGARVVLECHPGLERLLAGIAGVGRVVTIGTSVKDADVALPLMSVPYVLGLDQIAPQSPYIKAISKPPVTLPPGGFKVGLTWRGNPLHENDAARSVPLSAFGAVLSVAGATFFGLQVGEARSELTQVPGVTDLASSIGDFADTAALIAQLDLVISVDTAVAHLAAAMGKPTWILIARGNDWRWFHDRTDSPWYASVRLFRQSPPRRWGPPINALARALTELIERGA